MIFPFDLIHLGGEKCVTGSCHLMMIGPGVNVMVDCGLSQGNVIDKPFSTFPVSPSDIDYLFITHAHIDHIGRIPGFIQEGFSGEIICTHATKALLQPMLEDALSFSGKSENEKNVILNKIDDLSWGFEYNEVFSIKKGIKFKFGNAGHILGSCFIKFDIPDQKRLFSVIFSGDLGNIDTPILPDPDKPDSCNLLILESTYGGRVHKGRSKRKEQLGEILNKTLFDNGKVFIPAFALGRTQELIYEMDRLFSEGIIKQKVPVFIDSPLGLKITEIYSSLSKFWDKESKRLLNNGDHPIDFENLYSVENYKNHKRLLEIDGPAVIIAGSGMCNGGRILDHLENGIDNPVNDILFVGYQAKGTTGRDIVKYSKRANGYVLVKGQKLSIKADVYVLNGYSAHSDHNGLVNFVKSMPLKPEYIKLVHGEPDAQEALRSELEADGYNLL